MATSHSTRILRLTGLSGMGDPPMRVWWHGRLARDSRTQTSALPKHMGESPMPLNRNNIHGRVARATQPSRESGFNSTNNRAMPARVRRFIKLSCSPILSCKIRLSDWQKFTSLGSSVLLARFFDFDFQQPDKL